MSVYDHRQQLRQRETDEDSLLSLMYGVTDVDIDKIAEHIRTFNLTASERATLDRVCQDHRSEPKLFLLIFGLWLAPHLKLAGEALPRRFEPFQQALETMCTDMLEGRIVSLQEFVHTAVSEYVMGPKGKN